MVEDAPVTQKGAILVPSSTAQELLKNINKKRKNILKWFIFFLSIIVFIKIKLDYIAKIELILKLSYFQ